MSKYAPVDLLQTDPEDLQSLAYARRNWLPRNGKRFVSPATVYRWARHGVSGVRLKALFTSGGAVTSLEACKEFMREVDAARRAELDARKSQSVDATDDELESAGLR